MMEDKIREVIEKSKYIIGYDDEDGTIWLPETLQYAQEVYERVSNAIGCADASITHCDFGDIYIFWKLDICALLMRVTPERKITCAGDPGWEIIALQIIAELK